MGAWHTHDGMVGMPLLAPGAKLSEVEFLKLLNAHQWEALARLFAQPVHRVCNDAGERLYASVLHVELDFGQRWGPERFGEGARLVIRNRVRTFARRFVEGLFVFDDAAVTDDDLRAIDGPAALRAQGRPWAYMVNTFVSRGADNASLATATPAGAAEDPDALGAPPSGIDEHRRVQRTGEIPPFDIPAAAIALTADGPPIRYRIAPESDLNGAGLVYFARYAAITSYAERRFGERWLRPPLSNGLVESLSTIRRRLYYFANAAPKDVIEVVPRATVIPLDRPAMPPAGFPLPVRTPLEMLFRMDLYRRSDLRLIASSLVHKALNIPARATPLLLEAERFLGRLLKTRSK